MVLAESNLRTTWLKNKGTSGNTILRLKVYFFSEFLTNTRTSIGDTNYPILLVRVGIYHFEFALRITGIMKRIMKTINIQSREVEWMSWLLDVQIEKFDTPYNIEESGIKLTEAKYYGSFQVHGLLKR